MEKLTSWWKKTTEKCFTEYNLTQNEDSSKPDRAWIRAWFVSNYNIYKIPGYFYRYMNDCFSKLKPLDESMGAWRKIQKAQSEKYDTTEQKAKKLANKIVIEDKISNLFTEFDPKAREHDLNKPEVFKELLQGFLSKQLNIPVEIITVRDYLIDNEMNYVFEISYQTFDNLILKKDYSRRLSTMGFIEDLFSLKLRKRIGEHISLLITFQSNDNGTIKNIEIEFEVGNSEGGSESFIINFQISDINQTTAVFDFFSCILKILAEIENPEFMAYMLTTIILAVNEYEVGPLTAPDNKYQCLETGDYYLENLFISIFQKTIHNKELEKTYQENIIKMKSRYSKSYLQAINKLYQKILDYVRKCDQADEVLPSNHLLNESMDAFRKNRAKHNEDIQFTNPFSSFPPAFSRFSIEEQGKYLVDLIKTKFGRKLNASPRNHISFETKENNEDILNDNSVDIEYELRKENWKQRIGIVLFVEDFNPNSSNAEEYYNFYIGCTDLMECGKYGKCDFDTYRFTEKYADDPVMNQAGKIAWKQLISLQDIDNVSYFPRLQFTDKNAKYNLINFFRIVFSDEFNNLAYMITKNIISPYNEQLLTECKDKIESGKQPAIHLSTERGAEERHIEMLIKALCKQLFGKQYDSVYYDKETISHWFAPEKFMDIYNSWIKGEDTSSFIPEIDLKKIADKFRVELKSVSKTSDNSAVSESMDAWKKARKKQYEENPQDSTIEIAHKMAISQLNLYFDEDSKTMINSMTDILKHLADIFGRENIEPYSVYLFPVENVKFDTAKEKNIKETGYKYLGTLEFTEEKIKSLWKPFGGHTFDIIWFLNEHGFKSFLINYKFRWSEKENPDNNYEWFPLLFYTYSPTSITEFTNYISMLIKICSFLLSRPFLELVKKITLNEKIKKFLKDNDYFNQPDSLTNDAGSKRLKQNEAILRKFVQYHVLKLIRSIFPENFIKNFVHPYEDYEDYKYGIGVKMPIEEIDKLFGTTMAEMSISPTEFQFLKERVNFNSILHFLQNEKAKEPIDESMDTWNKVRKQHEEDNDGQDIRNGNKVVNGLIKSKEDMEISSRYNDGIDFDTAPESIRNMNRNPQIRQSILRIFRNVVRECLDTHFGISNIKFMEITEQYSFSPMIVSFSYGERKYVFEVMTAIITFPQYQINIRISEKNETMEDGSGVYGYRMRGNAVEFSFDVDTKERYIFLDVILFIQSTFKILFDPVFHYNKFLSFIKIISNLEYRFHEEKDNEGSSPLELESRNFESQLVEMYFYCSFLKINKQIALNIKNNSFDRIREYFTKQPFNYFSFSDFSSESEGAKVNANTFEHIKKGSFIMNEFSFLNKIVNRFEEQIKLNPNADMKKMAIEIMSEIMAELTQNDLKTIQVLSPERVNL